MPPKWNKEPVPCQCGCGEFIVPKWNHEAQRFSRFKLYHHLRLLRKFSDSQEAEIAQRYAQGEGAYDLADEFGTTPNTIYGICDRCNIPRQQITSQNRYQCNEEFFSVIDTEAKAYWLGFIAADGYVYCQPGAGYRLVIKLHPQDVKHLLKFKHDIGTDAPVADYSHYKSPCHQICVSSKRLVTDLAQHGIVQAKSTILKFPTTVPANLLRHYIRGVFDGDGSIWRGSYGEFSLSFVGTYDMMRPIRDILTVSCYMGRAKIAKQKGKNLHRFMYHCKGITRILVYLYEGATVYLDRKARFYHALIGYQPPLLSLGALVEPQNPTNIAGAEGNF